MAKQPLPNLSTNAQYQSSLKHMAAVMGPYRQDKIVTDEVNYFFEVLNNTPTLFKKLKAQYSLRGFGAGVAATGFPLYEDALYVKFVVGSL